ncbi:hypothetical protein VNO77_26661 [Canavalia gladiata]|uniref:Uncharacterized protein n=1 Tax=Canavalia gladiata TaxID=3824 RepID=A0AAN9KVI2_CANGL
MQAGYFSRLRAMAILAHRFCPIILISLEATTRVNAYSLYSETLSVRWDHSLATLNVYDKLFVVKARTISTPPVSSRLLTYLGNKTSSRVRRQGEAHANFNMAFPSGPCLAITDRGSNAVRLLRPREN